MGERASRMLGAGAGPYGCVDEGVCVCAYANLRYAETKGWESSENALGLR